MYVYIGFSMTFKQICYFYDAMNYNVNDEIHKMNTMLDFFESVADVQKDARFKKDDWQVRTFTGPQQTNSYDCGVFVCMFMYAFVTGKDLLKSFQQAQMETIRERLAWIFTDPEVSTRSIHVFLCYLIIRFILINRVFDVS